MLGSLKLGKIAGIEVAIHWSWLFIFFLVTWSFADGVLDHFFPEWSAARRWTAGVVVSLIFFASILLHELSHSLVARRQGIDVKGITLFVFGGVASLGREVQTAGQEFAIAVAGPLMSLALAALFGIGWAVLRAPAPGVAGISAHLAIINAAIAAFNMLPGFPLDGGRVFRSLVWWRGRNLLAATRTASRTGEGIAYLLMGVGVVFFFLGSLINGVWFIVIGMFLRNASSASYAQVLAETALRGVTAADVSHTDFRVVPPNISIQELVDWHVLSENVRCFPVVTGDELLGMITLKDVRRVPREEWAHTSVYSVMTPFERVRAVSPREDLHRVMQIMAEADVNQVPVVEGRLLVGMVFRSDILRLIQVRRELGIGATTS
jgi:Zn-dependent protease/predicted transcriptional regulator